MKLLKETHPIETSLQKIEDLLQELNISIEFYQNEIYIRDKETNKKYYLVNVDCGTPSRAYEIPRITDGDRLLYKEDEE